MTSPRLSTTRTAAGNGTGGDIVKSALGKLVYVLHNVLFRLQLLITAQQQLWPQRKQHVRRHLRNLRHNKNAQYAVAALLATALVCCTILQYHGLLVGRFAWVERRCAWSRLWPDHVLSKIQCVEAATHQAATAEPSLWAVSSQASRLWENLADERDDMDDVINAVSAAANGGPDAVAGDAASSRFDYVKHVHYIITSPPKLRPVTTLLRCSIESTIRLCHNCTVHVWIVSNAVESLHDESSDLAWFAAVSDILVGHPHYCLRMHRRSNSTTIDDGTMLDGPSCHQPCQVATSLRRWLMSDAATRQIPGHASDGWRLVAMHEWGGLYLDSDVLPLSNRLFRLPDMALALQNHRAAAYRLNGGVLQFPTVASTSTNSAVKCRTVQNTPAVSSRYLRALIEDHLHWAPQLASLPETQQTFGFMGPCALTRTFLNLTRQHQQYRFNASSAGEGDITIIPPSLLESSTSRIAGMCKQPHLGVHYSGILQRHWLALMGSKCARLMVTRTCPDTISKMHKGLI